jgi:biopolymer transport protein ExbB/TolQ
MDRVVEILYLLSTALLFPVVFSLFGCLAWALLTLGGFLQEIRERRKHERDWDSLEHILKDGDRAKPSRSSVRRLLAGKNFSGLFGLFAERAPSVLESELHLRALIAELEIAAAGRLAWLTFGVRIGPVLGLMGTLIPMGPALLGLSRGDVQEMSNDLVVAFCTTVLGLFVSAVFYGVFLTRRHWSAVDLSRMEYLFNCLFEVRDDYHALASAPEKSDDDFCSSAVADGS